MPEICVFAEKPSQAKAYSEAFTVKNRTKTHIEISPCSTFPNGAYITWGIGHLVELQQPEDYQAQWKKWSLEDLPIVPERFSEKVSKEKQAQFSAVKELFKKCAILVNAADVDREGSNIFYSVLHLTGVKGKTIKRLWINSLEKDEVLKGFNYLQDNEKDFMMFQEAKARQVSDWLVGINASRLFSLLMQQKGLSGSLSIGRVQSPCVYLIYQRQKEIENFVSKPFYQIEGSFNSEKGEYKGMADFKEEDREKVKAVLEQYKIKADEEIPGVVSSAEKKEKRQKSPKLHSLSTLQSIANKRWKYSPSHVLKIMQQLYEKRIVSYPRTDSNYITENEFAYLKDNISAYQQVLGVSFNPDLEPKKRHVDNSRVQEHYAIVPTKNIPVSSVLNNLSEDEKNIYHEVLATTLAMFHEDYIYEETTVFTTVNEFLFKTIGKIEKSKGWKSLLAANQEEKEKNETAKLPDLSEGDAVSAVVNIKDGMTKPPKPYTEGQLINMMKTCGKHIENEEDIDILKEIEGIGTEATRAGIIDTIKAQQYIEVKKNIVTVTEKGKLMCKAIDNTLLSSPSMTAKWESYLQKIGQGKGSKEAFIKNTTAFIKKLVDEIPQNLENLKISDHLKKSDDGPGIAKCPSCSKEIQDRNTFYGCIGFKDGCKVSFPKKFAGKTLTVTMVKQLCEKRQTNKLKGFKSKKGNSFDSVLKLDQEFKLKFDFGEEK